MRRVIAVVAALLTAGGIGALASAPAEARPPKLKLKKDFVTGLDHPWDIAFLSDRTMFFTERSGPISVKLPGQEPVELENPSDVHDQGGEGGMMGLAVHPDLAADPNTTVNRYIYACFSSDAPDGPATDNRLVRWEVKDDFTDLLNRQDIVTGIPHNPSAQAQGRHSGCRPRFKPGTTTLFVGTGDAAQSSHPQSPTSLGGKILRLKGDGTAHPDNPGGAWAPEVFNLGHRNVQGIAFEPGTGRGYSVEHGPGKNDEVNRILKGKNYGWAPLPPYNENVPMTDLNKFPDAVKAVWRSGNKTIAPSGATFLDGPEWKSYNGRLALALLDWDENVGQHLRILKVRADGTINKAKDRKAFAKKDTRLRSVVEGPDNRLYIATDGGDGSGAIWRVTPS